MSVIALRCAGVHTSPSKLCAAHMHMNEIDVHVDMDMGLPCMRTLPCPCHRGITNTERHRGIIQTERRPRRIPPRDDSPGRGVGAP